MFASFFGTFLHFPRKIFTENCSIKFHIQENKHKTFSGNSQPDPDVYFCKSRLLLFKFTGEERSMKNSPLGPVFYSSWGYISTPANNYFLQCNLPTYKRRTFTACSASSHSYFHHPLLQILHSAHPPFDALLLFSQILQANSCFCSTPIWNIASNYRRQICLLIFKICQ